MSPHLPSCTPAEFERVLRKLGFVEERQRGSHKVFVRASDNRTAVVPWHSRDLKRGTLHALVKSTGLTVEEFLKLLQVATATHDRRSARVAGLLFGKGHPESALPALASPVTPPDDGCRSRPKNRHSRNARRFKTVTHRGARSPLANVA